MEEEIINDGWLPEPNGIRETDYIAGKASGIEFEDRVSDTNWTPYLPDDERQHINGVETMSCVTFSALNDCEMGGNYLLAHNRFSDEARTFFLNHGYIVNGKFNFSDKFIAILSGTTKEGNYLTKVLDTIRTVGLIPESMLPAGNPKTWEEYHNPNQITQAMLDLGKESLKYLLVQYEWVYIPEMAKGETIDELHSRIYAQMRQAPFQLAKNGHATALYLAVYKNKWGQFETYNPFRREIPWATSLPYIMKIVVSPRNEYTEQEIADAKKFALDLVKTKPSRIGFRYEKNGEAYRIELDGSLKYKNATPSPLFTALCEDGTIWGINEQTWSKLKPALIK